jgi:hypothetical protein
MHAPIFDFSLQIAENKAYNIGTYAGIKNNMIVEGNCPEIVETCKTNVKNKKVDFRGRFFTQLLI